MNTCAICHRRLKLEGHFEPGIGLVGPECRKKVADLHLKLESLGLSDLLEGREFPALKQDDGVLDKSAPNGPVRFTVSSEQKAAVVLARQHGLRLYSTPVPHSSGLNFVLRVSVGAA